jgi:transposase-like protein
MRIRWKDECRGELIWLFLWVGRDIDTKEVVAFRASFTRSSLDAEIFLKQILEVLLNEPLFLADEVLCVQRSLRKARFRV